MKTRKEAHLQKSVHRIRRRVRKCFHTRTGLLILIVGKMDPLDPNSSGPIRRPLPAPKDLPRLDMVPDSRKGDEAGTGLEAVTTVTKESHESGLAVKSDGRMVVQGRANPALFSPGDSNHGPGPFYRRALTDFSCYIIQLKQPLIRRDRACLQV